MKRRLYLKKISGGMIVLILFTGISITLAALIVRSGERSLARIDDASRMRGEIQRLVKNELAGTPKDDSIARINRTIPDLINSRGDWEPVKSEPELFFSSMILVANAWGDIKKGITDYRRHPNDSNAQRLVSLSERAWLAADDAVNIASMAERRRLLRFYIIAAIAGIMCIALAGLVVYAKIYVRDRIEYLANHDAQTGLYNRNAFNRTLERECSLAPRTGMGFSLIMFDIDHFKKINDAYGHTVGDRVLKQFGELVRHVTRKSDFFARTGGEEFVVIVPGTDRDKVFLLAEKIRGSVERSRMSGGGHFTVSAGVVMYEQGDDPEKILKNADTALYRAKGRGRNRIEVM
jgi:diguanylate cyclase (GGDEF)-like protein